MHSTESSILVGLEGTEVTTEAKPDLQLPTKTWIITEKLEEVSLFMHQIDIDGGLDPGFVAGKFLCYSKDDTAKKPAFMRVYYQTPIFGTELLSSKLRATQAVPAIKLPELVAFKSLMMHACPIISPLLGYQGGKQPDDGIIPGGLATTIVWEKVPGVPLLQRFFWSLQVYQRKAIRDELRGIYQQLIRCGYQPFSSTSSKLIYDESTGNMYISGFRMDVPVDSTRKWTNTSYVTYMLAKAPRRTDWYEHESEWEL